MKIYLVQHAEAKSAEEDPSRSLSPEGELNIGRVARHLGNLGLGVDVILCSDKLRAIQTAEALAKSIRVKEGVRVRDDLNPNDDVRPMGRLLDDMFRKGYSSVAIVGHLPFLGRLASLLIAGSEDLSLVTFQNAGVVMLQPKPLGGGYSIGWVLTPAIVA
ncbi:MAG: phosphohistidine phosphatase SixA [Candidatus Bathyarchaeia archaeon]